MCCIIHPQFKASIKLRVRLCPPDCSLTPTATQARAGSPRSTVRQRTFQFRRRCILRYQPEEIFCIHGSVNRAIVLSPDGVQTTATRSP